MAIELRSRLERVVATTLPSSVAFSYPTVVALSAFLDETVAARTHTSDGLRTSAHCWIVLIRCPTTKLIRC